MKRSTAGFWIGLIGSAFLLAQPVMGEAPAAPTTQPAKYIRFLDKGTTGSELETADVTFTNDAGATVHLIAAVHIGEHGYYENLSKSFEGYDAVLYEMIKDRDSAPPAGNGAGEKSTSFISKMQVFMKDSLGLEFQLDDIDYTKPNFVHADLDRQTFEQMESDRGESMLSLLLQQAFKEMSDQAKNPTVDPNDEMTEMVQLFCRPDGKRQFKLMLAREMDQMEMDGEGMGGPDGSVIVTERNKAAMKALDASLADGKKKIAIFYGAAHMPDMSKRLAERGFKPVSTDWRMAWDLTIRPDQPSVIESVLQGMIDSMEK
jgi:hypothetical protein